MIDSNAIQAAAAALRRATRVVALTGAGISAESGVPTFREAQTGLWAQYDPEQLATRAAFQRDPRLVWDWYAWRRALLRAARPNPGHEALARLAARIPAFTLVTQNVDDLHEAAGSTDVIHLHGSIAANKCFFDCQGAPTPVDITEIQFGEGPPPCPHCGRWVRPDVVWFGEVLPPSAIEAAYAACATADVMLVVGTSGLVAPAAHLPHIA